MKKFLLILITGILWCTNIYAEFIELKKCFRSERYGHANTSKKGTAEDWDSWWVTYSFVGDFEKCKVTKYYTESGEIIDSCKSFKALTS